MRSPHHLLRPEPMRLTPTLQAVRCIWNALEVCDIAPNEGEPDILALQRWMDVRDGRGVSEWVR